MEPRNLDLSLPPSAGGTPNFINPQSQVLMVLVTSVLYPVLILLTSLPRFYTNLWIIKSLRVDESTY